MGVLGGTGLRRQGATKPPLFGSAAGVAFALQATVTKMFDTVVGGGPSAILSSWTIYVLIASALVGFVLQQSALKTGILAPAMASSNRITLFGSVVFGITVYGETLSSNGGTLAPTLIGLGAALVAVVLLAGAKPPEGAEPLPRPEQPPDAGDQRPDSSTETS